MPAYFTTPWTERCHCMQIITVEEIRFHLKLCRLVHNILIGNQALYRYITCFISLVQYYTVCWKVFFVGNVFEGYQIIVLQNYFLLGTWMLRALYIMLEPWGFSVRIRALLFMWITIIQVILFSTDYNYCMILCIYLNLVCCKLSFF